jgi:hypothetical protein
MHGKSFSERFRSKNAPPPRPAKGTKRQKPAHRPRLIGAPLEFVADVCRLTQGRTALVVALCIYRRVHVCGDQTVTLPSDELDELGIDRRRKGEALTKLQQAGLIKVENARGRTARVTLIWQRS